MNEPQVLNPLKGQTDNGWHYEQEVYDAEGIARAVKAGGGSGNIPKVIEPQVLTPKRTEEGKRMRKDYESHKVTKQRKEMQQLEPREDGVSNTLTTAQKDNYLMEPIMYQRAEKVMRENEVQEGDTINPYNETLNDTGISPTLTTRPEGNKTAILAVVEDWKTIVGNKQMNPFRGSVEEESPCITSACGCGGGMTPMVTNADLETTKTKEFIEQMRGHKQMQYRIRKLTERECFRLWV
jgi:predicted transposase YbfD/YdcC